MTTKHVPLRRSLRLETLEAREVPALYVTFENLIPAYHDGRVGGNLNITGTNGPDRIVVRQINGRITIDGVKEIAWIDYTGRYGTGGEYKTRDLPASMVHFINIHAGDGDDRIFLNSQDVPGQQALRPLLGTRIEGGNGNDHIVGSEGKDQIYGGAGDDSIYGRGGDDLLYGGSGNDVIYGGTGNDILRGESGNDKLYGNEGDDVLIGGSGDDLLSGNQGKDDLYGQSGSDTLYGVAGEDYLNGGADDDTLFITVSFPKLMANPQQTLPYSSYADGSAGRDTIDVTIGTHGFSTAVLGPYLARLRQTIRTFAPLVNRLQTKIPLVSQFDGGRTVGSYIAGLAGASTSYAKFMQLYNTIASFASIDALTGTNYHLGRFTVTGTNTYNISTQVTGQIREMIAGSSLLRAARNAGVKISFLDNPATLLQALMGMTGIDLVRYTVPTFDLSFNNRLMPDQHFTVGPVPVKASLHGLFRLKLEADFRLQSQALTQGLSEGLVINAKATLSAGVELRAVSGGSFKFRGVTVAGAEVGAAGGITGNLYFQFDPLSRKMNRSGDITYSGRLFASFRVLGVGYDRDRSFVSGRF